MIFHYKGFHGCDAKCGLEVIRHKDKDFDVVVATELHDNPGTSITNMAEGIATLVCKEFDIPPSRLLWIEHYPERPSGTPRKPFPESFDRVWFTWTGEQFRSPRWRPLSTEQVEAIKKGEDFDWQGEGERPDGWRDDSTQLDAT